MSKLAHSNDETMLEIEVSRCTGCYAGEFDPDEYEPLIEAGLLRKVYEGAGGFLGLAKLERATRYPQVGTSAEALTPQRKS